MEYEELEMSHARLPDLNPFPFTETALFVNVYMHNDKNRLNSLVDDF